MGPKRPSLLDSARGAASKLFVKKEKDAPDAAIKMGNIDKGFFGEDDDDDDVPISKREKGGLLDDEPDRAETDFYIY